MTFSMPAHAASCEDEDAEISAIFVDPLPSRATRKPPLRSTASNRGEIFSPLTGHILVYESNLERRAILLLLASSKVKDIWDQPTPVSYIDADGRKRSHTFDLLVTMTTGKKIAVAVKPRSRAIARRLFDTAKVIASQLDPSFAHKVVVLTEHELDPVSAHDAEIVLMARRVRDPEADAGVERVAHSLIGSVSVQQLIHRIGLGSARGFSAIARAIGAGLLRRVSTGRLDFASQIKSLVSGEKL